MKIFEYASSIDPDEVAHYEPPHLDQHYLPSSLQILSVKRTKHLLKFRRRNYVVCF